MTKSGIQNDKTWQIAGILLRPRNQSKPQLVDSTMVQWSVSETFVIFGNGEENARM